MRGGNRSRCFPQQFLGRTQLRHGVGGVAQGEIQLRARDDQVHDHRARTKTTRGLHGLFDRAHCMSGVTVCTALPPHCEQPYVVAYVDTCYEGCVRTTECLP